MSNPAKKLFNLLASNKLGVVSGFVLAALLAWASLNLPSPRGPNPLPWSENILLFFDPPAAHWYWFYLLLAATFVYGLNGALATIKSAIDRYRAGTISRRWWGITLMHVGFILGLLSHLLAGFTAGTEDAGVVSAIGTKLAGRTVQLQHFAPIVNPDGSLRTIEATLEVEGREGELSFGYNDPIFLDGMTRYLLIRGPQMVAAAQFKVGGQAYTLVEGDGFAGPNAEYIYRGIQKMGPQQMPYAVVTRRIAGGQEDMWLKPGQSAGSDRVVFTGPSDLPGLAVGVNRNDAIPLLFVTMTIFLLGALLFVSDGFYSRVMKAESRLAALKRQPTTADNSAPEGNKTPS